MQTQSHMMYHLNLLSTHEPNAISTMSFPLPRLRLVVSAGDGSAFSVHSPKTMLFCVCLIEKCKTGISPNTELLIVTEGQPDTIDQMQTLSTS